MTKIYGRIYCVTNLVNGKRYVGQTVQSIEARWRAHRRRTGGCPALSSAIRKYGAEQFKITEIAVARSQAELDVLEIIHIERMACVAPRGYNLSGGGLGAGRMHSSTRDRQRAIAAALWASEDFRVRQRAAVKALWATAEFRRKAMAAMGDPEYSARRSELSRRRWKTDPRHRALLTEKLRARWLSPEMAAKKKAAALTMWASPGHREKMAGVMANPQTKRRIREANASAAVKRKRSESAKKMWQRQGHREKVAASRAMSAGK